MKKIYSFFIMIFTLVLLSSCGTSNYTETSYTYQITDEISDIDINWNIGNITITSGNKFTIEETSIDGKCVAPLKYTINDRKLDIDYNESKKDIKITLDKEIVYNIINIDSITSNLTVSKVSINVFIGTIKKGTLNVLASSIEHCDINITCQNNWAWAIINNNHFKFINITIESIAKFSFTSNTSDYSSFKIGKCVFDYQNNKCKSTCIFLSRGKIELNLNNSSGYDISSFAKVTIIDFETINYNNRYIYKNGENRIHCSNKNGEVLITRT